jgi:hypothetical protein
MEIVLAAIAAISFVWALLAPAVYNRDLHRLTRATAPLV